jgi:hypothetical protein
VSPWNGDRKDGDTCRLRAIVVSASWDEDGAGEGAGGGGDVEEGEGEGNHENDSESSDYAAYTIVRVARPLLRAVRMEKGDSDGIVVRGRGWDRHRRRYRCRGGQCNVSTSISAIGRRSILVEQGASVGSAGFRSIEHWF